MISSKTLAGKIAVVTGSTSGIGLGVARMLAERGADVVINGLGDADAIETIRAQIEADFGTRCHYSAANMLNPEDIRGMIETAGGCDILVNNAGIQFVSPVDEFPEDRFAAIIAINLAAPFHAIKAAVPHMKAAGWGRIINIASAHALVASPFKSAYVASKHGVAGLTKSVALEVAAQGITVNAICPGYVWTPLVESQIPDTMAARGLSREEVINDVLLAAQPTKKFVQIEEVAAFAGFLCSDGAASITGAVLPIEGGWTAH